jgi:hypothetical protein
MSRVINLIKYNIKNLHNMTINMPTVLLTKNLTIREVGKANSE